MLKKLPDEIYKIIINMYYDLVILELKKLQSNYIDRYYVYTNEILEDRDLCSVVCWNIKIPHVRTIFNIYYVNELNRNMTGLQNSL